MAKVETDPERLNGLTKEANSKTDRELGFLMANGEVFLNLFRRLVRDNDSSDFSYIYKPFGNFINRPLVNVHNFSFGSAVNTMQIRSKPKFCQIIEQDFYRCTTRVGLQNAQNVCKIYWDDLIECQTHNKSKKRAAFMRRIREGKRLPPFTDIPLTAYMPHKPE